ncbi:unnamed protein product [Adineta steineri]|uniref:Uncharacterized protein n=1 Tax=Adineta steineri TaxID=433720 RepID=A0A813SRZ2_9BILA|nr:unnamed protein product [Adineta steineri]CAF3517682.1 unnamed protein product [Adineta steineri]
MPVPRKKPAAVFKILLIGDSAVGKTSLMFRYHEDKFIEKFTPTIGMDFVFKNITIHGQEISLQLWDTAGQERFLNITKNYYRNADAVVLVYDRTVSSSFKNISRWMKTIAEEAPEDILKVLVANKSDLHRLLVVSTQEGQDLAKQYGIHFFETSAKLDINNVAEIFDYIAHELFERKKPRPVSGSGPIILDDQSQKSFFSCC